MPPPEPCYLSSGLNARLSSLGWHHRFELLLHIPLWVSGASLTISLPLTATVYEVETVSFARLAGTHANSLTLTLGPRPPAANIKLTFAAPGL
eukprot:scaffold168528_cov14-Tisochrysis_lutea.AAC.1